MTTPKIDIEQERREFDADEEGIFIQREGEGYANPFVQSKWEGWLARAKRSMDSAEPVKQRRIKGTGAWVDLDMDDSSFGKESVHFEYRTLYTAPPAPVSAEPVLYRCFHCHEEFHDVESAGLHFGKSQVFDPACTIDIARFREMEQRMISYNEEDAEIHQQMAGLRNQHAIDLRREEEKGYARGLRDAVKYPDEVAPPPTDAKDGERLDWLAEECCAIESLSLKSATKYRLHWPEIEECQGDWYNTPRAAIDAQRAAIAAKEAK